MLTSWRIASPEFSTTPKLMMSGEGAYLFGGRWNSKGTRVVYLGTSLAQASMEMLVHLGRADILKSYLKLEVSFDEALVQHIDLTDLPDDWAEPTMASAVQSVGDNWVRDMSSLVLQVPSAAIVGEYNYLFNPIHPDLEQAVFGEVKPFSYGPRLLK